MSIKDLQNKTSGISARPIEKGAAREPRTAPMIMYDVTARMHEAEAKAEQLTQALEEARRNGEILELPIDQLHEVPGRRRHLSPEQYSELRENLRHNKIIDKPKVRPRAEGGWEIISGHNKIAITAELGATTIVCFVETLDDVQAELEAFYANLFQTTLPEYEQYLGFKLMREKSPHTKQADMVKFSGKSKSAVSELMAYDDLPEAAHEILIKQTNALGRRAAAELAAFARKGRGAEVVEAVRLVADGSITQADAVELLVRGSSAAGSARDEKTESTEDARPKHAPRKKAEGVSIKSGRSNYCSVFRAAKVVRIEFNDKEEAEEVEEAIREVLQRRADERSGKK